MRILLSRIYVTILALAFLVTHSGWEERKPGLSVLLLMAAIFLCGLGALGRVWCSLHIAGRKQRELVTDGPYSLLRNPLYLFSFIGALGIGFSTGTLLFPAAVAVAFVLYYPGIIRKEEAEMERRHGEVFRLYRSSVPCFLPRVSGWREDVSLMVNPAVFRRHLSSALWFVWALALVILVEAAKHGGWLPVWFQVF